MQTRRPVLQSKLQNILCKSKSKPDSEYKTLDLWHNKIFSAQLSIKELLIKKSTLKSSTLRTKLDKVAQGYSKQLKNHSYGVVMCNSRKAFVFSTPEPKFIADDLVNNKIKSKKIQNYCRKFKISYINYYNYTANRVPIKYYNNLKDFYLKYPKEIISITCWPKQLNHDGSSQGAQLWTVFPTNSQLQTYKNKFDVKKNKIIDIINSLRKRALLKTVVLDKTLNKAAKELAQNTTVRHSYNAMKKVAAQIYKKNNFKLLGENRVQAQNANELMWLMWNSAEHRSLILHKDATHLGLYQNKTSKLQFLELIFVKKEG